MKHLPTLVFLPFVFACSGDQLTGDAGPDASNDATTTDGSSSDGSSSDAGTDASKDAAADSPASDGGGLGQGDPCDPKNDQCQAGLKCCGGGVILQDSGINYRCMQKTDAGTCPIVP